MPLCLSSCWSFELQCPSLYPGQIAPLLWGIHWYLWYHHSPWTRENNSLRVHIPLLQHTHTHILRQVCLCLYPQLDCSLLMGRGHATPWAAQDTVQSQHEEVVNTCALENLNSSKNKCWTYGSYSEAHSPHLNHFRTEKKQQTQTSRKKQERTSQKLVFGESCVTLNVSLNCSG